MRHGRRGMRFRSRWFNCLKAGGAGAHSQTKPPGPQVIMTGETRQRFFAHISERYHGTDLPDDVVASTGARRRNVGISG